MRCRKCGHDQSKVMDSRFRPEQNLIRRRRLCLSCGYRFTTHERVVMTMPLVIKKDDSRESFEREKVYAGIRRACEKLPISVEQMENLVGEVERYVQEIGSDEVPSSLIGEFVVQRLRDLHPVAYVRFASVYKSFKDVDDFMLELKEILDDRK
ncbi:MAG: transcriptional regulator NrdR [Candidatus Lernaella stagnicola]|nr:transcriptional regulator NrdR [Candidatus Lernaella stagnicola]